MARLTSKRKERIKDIKKNIQQSHEYFKDNIKRYEEFTKFVFKTSLSKEDIAILEEIGKPTLEFNILESYISRLRGEFAKQQPKIKVRASDALPYNAITKELIGTIDVVESHLQAVFFDASNDMMEYNVFSDLLAGGFSVFEVYTDYLNDLTTKQGIFVERGYNPTTYGFDSMAEKSHKGDGAFCWKKYPLKKHEFEEEFGKDKTRKLKFNSKGEGFEWSYNSNGEDVVIVCDYYEKEREPVTIYEMPDGQMLTEEEYDKKKEAWNLVETAVFPEPVDKRKTFMTTIVRYRTSGEEVLKFDYTDYSMLPFIFVDGNSALITENDATHQMTRPYVFHAKGIQKLKNFAGQTLANELENMVAHKFIMAAESIPIQYQDALNDMQRSQIMIYNHFHEENGIRNQEQVLPPPIPVQRTPIPPQISETFRMSDEMSQVILGTFDSAMGNVNKQTLSGVAVEKGAMQSNNASMPFVVGYLKGLNRAAQVYLDLFPKYYKTPRTIPILKPNGKRDYVTVNVQGGIDVKQIEGKFSPLDVKVEAGVNFAMQKEIALQTIVNMMKASPLFAEFINSLGLELLLDNIDIRGIDDLKEKASEFMQQRAQQQKVAQQQQQMEMQMQQQAAMLKMQQMQRIAKAPTKEEVDAFAAQAKAQNDAANVSVKERDSDTKFMEAIAKMDNMDVDNAIKEERIDAENMRTQVEADIQISNHIMELEQHIADMRKTRLELQNMKSGGNDEKEEEKD